MADARRGSRLVGRGSDTSPASMIPRAPLPLGAHSGVSNTTIVTAFRPGTHLSIATATDPNIRALRVAGDTEVRGLCEALYDTPIRVRLHHQLPADRISDVPGVNRRTARLLEHITLSHMRRPGRRSSCSFITLSCYVAIPTLHDNRTDTIA